MKKKVLVSLCVVATFALSLLGTRKASVSAIVQDNTEALVETIYNVWGEPGLNVTTKQMGDYSVNYSPSRKKAYLKDPNFDGWTINDKPICKANDQCVQNITNKECWKRWRSY